MFSGVEYNNDFEEACQDLAVERDPRQVRQRLMNIEWVLWDAIKGVFIQISSILACLIVLPLTYLMSPDRSWVVAIGGLLTFLILGTLIYWVCRIVFYFEISRHVRPRSFGQPDWR